MLYAYFGSYHATESPSKGLFPDSHHRMGHLTEMSNLYHKHYITKWKKQKLSGFHDVPRLCSKHWLPNPEDYLNMTSAHRICNTVISLFLHSPQVHLNVESPLMMGVLLYLQRPGKADSARSGGGDIALGASGWALATSRVWKEKSRGDRVVRTQDWDTSQDS